MPYNTILDGCYELPLSVSDRVDDCHVIDKRGYFLCECPTYQAASFIADTINKQYYEGLKRVLRYQQDAASFAAMARVEGESCLVIKDQCLAAEHYATARDIMGIDE